MCLNTAIDCLNRQKKVKEVIMRNLFILSFLFSVFVSSCSAEQDKDIALLRKQVKINNEILDIKCMPSLFRMQSSASLVLVIKEKWSPEPPWKNIKMEDGTIVEIKIILTDEDNKEYTPSIIGSGGGGLIAKFRPEVPKSVKIKNISLKANKELTIEKIIWHNWTPE